MGETPTRELVRSTERIQNRRRGDKAAGACGVKDPKGDSAKHIEGDNGESFSPEGLNAGPNRFQ